MAVRPTDPAPAAGASWQPVCAMIEDSACAEHWAERPERGPLRERPPTGIFDHRQLASLRGRRLRRLGPRDDPASCPLGKKGFPLF